MRRRSGARRALPYLLALIVALIGTLGVMPKPEPVAVRETAAHVVLVGAPGLRWDDVSPVETPTLWALAQRGSVGALAVRSARGTTCPADGWLTLGAGNYARAVTEAVDGRCPLGYPTVERTGPGTGEESGGGAKLNEVEHDAITAENRELPWDLELGALSESVRCTAAVGPGAAVAAARPFGRIDQYRPTIDSGLGPLLASCGLSFVDLGTVDGEGTARTVAARRVDAVLTAVLAARPEGSLVVVAGLADTDEAARLHVAVAHGPGFGRGWLTSPSTGRAGYVRLIDLAPTALAALDRPAPAKLFAGAAATSGTGRPTGLDDAVDRLADADRLAGAQRRVSTGFFLLLAAAQLTLFLLVIPLLRRARPGRAVRAGRLSRLAGYLPGRARWRARRSTVATVTGPATGAGRRGAWMGRLAEWALLAAALAVPAAMIADIVPWWRSEHPAVVFTAIFVATLAAVTTVTRLLTGRYRALGPLGGVAGAVALAVTLDVLTGARLQLNGVTGYSALAGGRYAGIGTIGLGMFVGGVLLAAGCLAQRVERVWRPVVVTVVGTLAVVVVGSPYLGADAGGAVALTAGVCAAAAMSAGGWLTYRRLTWAVLAGLALTATFALVDGRRPAEQRSSVGRFLLHLDDGTVGTVVTRTGESSIVTFVSSPLTLLVLGAGLFAGLVLIRPWGGLRRVCGLFPAVRGALTGVVVATLLAGAIEGVALNPLGAALSVVLPLVVLVALRVQHRADDRTPAVRIGPHVADPPAGGVPVPDRPPVPSPVRVPAAVRPDLPGDRADSSAADGRDASTGATPLR